LQPKGEDVVRELGLVPGRIFFQEGSMFLCHGSCV
jgi:hypothetical protein